MKKGIVAMISTTVGVIAGMTVNSIITGKHLEETGKKVDKFKNYYNMLNQWLVLKQKSKSLVEYFEKNNYRKIAIYGMGEMGTRLCDELIGSEIKVAYAIDKNAGNTYSDIAIIKPEDAEDNVDVVVITAIFAVNEIEKDISKYFTCPIISLEDIVFDI